MSNFGLYRCAICARNAKQLLSNPGIGQAHFADGSHSMGSVAARSRGYRRHLIQALSSIGTSVERPNPELAIDDRSRLIFCMSPTVRDPLR
jgi:hypothetical protein